MITLGGSAPRGTVRGTLFCWPLIWVFEADGGAADGEGLWNGVHGGGCGGPPHHSNTPMSSKMKTMALKQNSKCPLWELPHQAQETHTPVLHCCVWVCIYVVHTITFMYLNFRNSPNMLSHLDFPRPPDEWLSPEELNSSKLTHTDFKHLQMYQIISRCTDKHRNKDGSL